MAQLGIREHLYREKYAETLRSVIFSSQCVDEWNAMGINIGVVRSAPEMFSDIDHKIREYGGQVRSVHPEQLYDLSCFSQGDQMQGMHPDLIFVPLSCLDSQIDGELMKVIEEAAQAANVQLAWLMSDSELNAWSQYVNQAMGTGQLASFLDSLRAQFDADGAALEDAGSHAIPDQHQPQDQKSSARDLLKKFKNWADDVIQGDESSVPEDAHSQLHKIPEAEPAQQAVRDTQYRVPAHAIPEFQFKTVTGKEDSKVLQQYIHLKEEEIAALKNHVSMFEVEHQKMMKEIESLKNDKSNLDRTVDTLRGRLLFLEQENDKIKQQKAVELNSLRSEYKNKIEKLTVSENSLKEQELKFEDLRNRIKRDLFSVQERERYLQARMDILRSDTELLLHQKDEKILELVEGLRQAEFKIEALQETLARSKEIDDEERDKSERIVRALKLATSLLDKEEEKGSEGEIRKREN